MSVLAPTGAIAARCGGCWAAIRNWVMATIELPNMPILPVAPWLLGGPLDEVVAVVGILRGEQFDVALGEADPRESTLATAYPLWHQYAGSGRLELRHRGDRARAARP